MIFTGMASTIGWSAILMNTKSPMIFIVHWYLNSSSTKSKERESNCYRLVSSLIYLSTGSIQQPV